MSVPDQVCDDEATLSVPVQPSLQLVMSVPPDWARIDHVRESLQLSVRAAYAPVLVGDRVSIVVSELLENAIKYGEKGPIRIELLGDRHMVQVAVTNHVAAGCSKHDKLEPHLAWLESFDDPQQAYMACLTMAFQRPNDPSATGSGLGLARIRYEGDCTLTQWSGESGLLTVVARQRVDWNNPDQSTS